ncbi:hypothetical protein [Haloferax larsenii]|uniref:Uncharacterized protein n=1 Tax=Haloferax larsenii TaxID=302484 RepID=A0A1H7N0X1_HALLR|nr:hypothetical protein [Haloferax larsenii]SEL17236.1 hypothetical protein SAMN04488691_103161 [Haloferax larsenii]
MDIGLNSDFDIELDHRNDLPLVTGKAAFEQALRIRLTDYFDEIVGTVSQSNAANLLRIEARRVVTDMDELDRVASIVIEPSSDDPNTLDVTVFYSTGEQTPFSISE